MPKQPDNWPTGCLPRMLDVRQASYYVGISPATFLECVKRGRYSQGVKEGSRVLWDRKAIDAILDLRSGLTEEYAENIEIAAEEARALAALRGGCTERPATKAGALAPVDPAAIKAYVAQIEERFARNRAVDEDPEAIARILAAHEAGESSGEIGAREGLTGQKVAGIVKRAKRKPHL